MTRPTICSRTLHPAPLRWRTALPRDDSNDCDQARSPAWTATTSKDATDCIHVARGMRPARATARRERQIVQIAALVIARHAERAERLNSEHAADFLGDTAGPRPSGQPVSVLLKHIPGLRRGPRRRRGIVLRNRRETNS